MLELVEWFVYGLFAYSCVKVGLIARKDKWSKRALLPAAATLAVIHLWWWVGFVINQPITVVGDALCVVAVVALDRWLVRFHLRGPWTVTKQEVAQAIDWALAQVPMTGQRTQDRTCLWDDVNDQGSVLVGDQRLAVLRFEPPERLNKAGLQALILALVQTLQKSGKRFKILRLTRPLDISAYKAEITQQWHQNTSDDPKLEPVLKEHLLQLQPHLIRDRDPQWPLSLGTCTFVVIEYDDYLIRRLQSLGRSAKVAVQRLDTYQVVAFLRQLLNHEVLTLEADRGQAETAADLRDMVAPAQYRVHRNSIEVTGQSGEIVWWGFFTASLTGETALADLAEAAAKTNLDLTVEVRPLDPSVEAPLLSERPKATDSDRQLAAEYQSGTDAPVEVHVLLTLRTPSQESLRRAQDEIVKGFNSTFRGVVLRPVVGFDQVETAFQAVQPLLTPVSASSLKQPATELGELLISVGNMELEAVSETAIIAGQDFHTGMPLAIDLWDTNGPQRIPANLAELGVSGSGKTFGVRWYLTQLVLKGSINDYYIVDPKGQGDWGQWAEKVCPANVRLVVIDLEKEEPLEVLKDMNDEENLLLVVETTSIDETSQFKLNQLTDWCWKRQQRRYRKNNGNKTIWVFDEAWVAFRRSDDPFGNFILRAVKQSRGWNGRVVVVTQDPMDLVATSEGAFRLGEQVLAQCALTMIGAVRDESTDHLVRWGVPETLARTVPHFSRGQFAFQRMGQPDAQLVQLFVTPVLAELVAARNGNS